MRQRAKPFRVEVKKSRKNGTQPRGLFGSLDIAEDASELYNPGAAAAAAEKLFGRPANKAGVIFHQADPAQTAEGSPIIAIETPVANRILPDLTWEAPAVPAEAPARRPRTPRLAGPAPIEATLKAPKKTAAPKRAKPAPAAEVRPAPAQPVAKAAPKRQAKPVGSRSAGRRAAAEDASLATLRAGERWKRRLPRVLR